MDGAGCNATVTLMPSIVLQFRQYGGQAVLVMKPEGELMSPLVKAFKVR